MHSSTRAKNSHLKLNFIDIYFIKNFLIIFFCLSDQGQNFGCKNILKALEVLKALCSICIIFFVDNKNLEIKLYNFYFITLGTKQSPFFLF